MGRTYKLAIVTVLSGLVMLAIIYGMYEWLDKQPLLFYIVLLVGMNLSFSIWYGKRNQIRSMFNNLITLFLLFFTLYSITYPLDHIIGSLHERTEEELVNVIQLYVLANICMLIGITVASVIRLKKGRPKFSKSLWTPEHIEQKEAENRLFRPLLFWPALIVLLIGIAIMAYDQTRLGGFASLGAANRIERFKAISTVEGISLPWKSIITSSLLLLAMSVRTRAQLKLFGFIVLLLTFFFFFLIGSRLYVVIALLPSLALFIDRGYIRISRFQHVVLILIMMVFISSLFNNARLSLIEDVPLSSFPPERWAFSTGETGAGFLVTLDITSVDHYPEADPSYLTSVAYMLPSVVYQSVFGHGKPRTLGDWYVWYFYPYIFNEGGGRGFSPIAQAWMVGGHMGIVVQFFVVGVLLVWISRTSMLKYICLPLAIMFQRSPMNVVVMDIAYAFVFVIFIVVLAAIMRPKVLEQIMKRIPERHKANTFRAKGSS
ncbi:O-antigen polysaccharide polymerase Wzy family protein [Paenibacillus sp. SC116]|uniref:O-antigen polysaccharide polymerase Wzy family protein n=1 Tax=Paenibacillus sp. SC116 TaxID=2968986 RepID=UPI00215A2CB4|nr:O-antigen polysaccharide polymerase Wzy family protein [Paenibacillus sp. SC116]MCR8844174.1 O-antigen polysaccharide polymerase Wzy family protein [Paenibacillus sp. SC116]